MEPESGRFQRVHNSKVLLDYQQIERRWLLGGGANLVTEKLDKEGFDIVQQCRYRLFIRYHKDKSGGKGRM